MGKRGQNMSGQSFEAILLFMSLLVFVAAAVLYFTRENNDYAKNLKETQDVKMRLDGVERGQQSFLKHQDEVMKNLYSEFTVYKEKTKELENRSSTLNINIPNRIPLSLLVKKVLPAVPEKVEPVKKTKPLVEKPAIRSNGKH